MENAIDARIDAHRESSRLRSAIKGTLQAALATYRLGGRTMVAAPAIIAIIVLPQLAQHVVEINLGMFESKKAFKALQEEPIRWAFAWPKIIGLVLAILAVARFWALGSVRNALLVPPRTIFHTLLMFGLGTVIDLPFKLVREASSLPSIDMLATAVSSFAQIGFFICLVGALLDDRMMSIRRAFSECLPSALLIASLAALAFIPAHALHTYNHVLASGQPLLIVWALMLFDSILVGLLAALVGSALFVGYRAGPSWRGWTTQPESIS